MGAGLSQKQINSRIYNQLQSYKRKLEAAGVACHYRRFQLSLLDNNNVGGGFNIACKTLRASNGETAGFYRIYIEVPETGLEEYYGFPTRNGEPYNGTFDQGLERLRQLFWKSGLDFNRRCECGAPYDTIRHGYKCAFR